MRKPVTDSPEPAPPVRPAQSEPILRGALMKDVAARAGVSKATVSRVLSGTRPVREPIRVRVLEVIEETGYRPNRIARNLRRGKTRTLGVVVTDIENTHFTAMMRATEDAAYRRGYTVILCNTDENHDKQAAYLDMLAEERVQGVILTPADPAAREIGRLLNLGIPVVATDRPVHDPRADAVVVDNQQGTRVATEHLIGLGHRRIGFISGPRHITAGSDRLQGYLDVMEEAGLEARYEVGEFTIESGLRAAGTLLAEGGLTALIASNGTTAFGAIQAIDRVGLRMPDDLAFVAFDEPFWMSLLPITTFAQPVQAMAETSVDLILDRIAGERPPRRVVFSFEMHVRQSSLADHSREDGRDTARARAAPARTPSPG
jgi:LacI family transcriptional regulator